MAILGTCRLCGVERVYRMGGAQAIAALACGTETIPRVDVIVGPGNLYVQEAKRLLSGVVGIDGFAGPSDLLVALAADASRARGAPRRAGHARAGRARRRQPRRGGLAGRARDRGARTLLPQLAAERATVADAALALVQVSDARDALELANTFAPEHLQLIGPELEGLAPLVRSAGCLFVGAASATAFGDYVAGSNHVLPTAGAARFASISRRVIFGAGWPRCESARAAESLAAAGPIARAEGFEVHADRCRRAIGDESQTMAHRDDRAQDRRDRRQAGARAGRQRRGERDTGVGFLDHMLDLLARHGRLDLDVKVSGDLQTGAHHTAEDTAIVLGQALDRRSATAQESSAMARRPRRWTRRGRAARSTSRGVRSRCSRRACRPAPRGASSTS